ncbi:MAG TPA: trypsin-like serine protease [Nannocystaceae bacterium]|nr:trypsin-like serine protease [Nannocystaceae bacterium]
MVIVLGMQLVLAWSNALVGETPPPLPIVGGTDAATCEWPAVVAMLEDDETPVMCSGSLIHPEVVMTAAHCIIPERPIVGLGFGEAGQVFGTPARVVAPTECVPHPDYENFGAPDVAYCRLAEAVTDVPIVPVLAGCESEALQPGVEVTIVGFGATYGTYVDEMVMAMGVGAKRYTTQTIDYVDDMFGEVNMVGPNGSQSACFGDSGGPSLVQLADGSWRVFGTGSHLYDPGDLPPPIEEGNVCGSGVAYGYVTHALEWLEQETALDLTPCWDGDDFVASAACGDFPLAPGIASGSWDDGCVGGALGGGEMNCEPVSSDSSSDGGESSDGGVDTSGGSGDSTTGVVADDSGSGSADTSTGGSASASATGVTTTITSAGEADGTAGSSESGSGGENDDGKGCGCDQRGRTSPLLLLLFFAIRARSAARR